MSDDRVFDLEDKTPIEEPHVAVNAAAEPQAPMIRNLNEIEQYLKPFVDNFRYSIPNNSNEFYMKLFEYRNELAKGEIPAYKGERIKKQFDKIIFQLNCLYFV